MKKAIVLLSGGLDSATCLAHAINGNYECHAISFNYGQRHSAELFAAKKLVERYPIASHQVISLSIGDLGGSALTDTSQEISLSADPDSIPNTYVPARNTTFLSIALGWAEIKKADAIYIGVSAVDYSGYPDCRPEYIAAFQHLANLATKAGVEGNAIEIKTPLINLNKAQTVQMGTDLGMDYSLTVSCYRATESGLACGRCDSCFLRKKGFMEANLKDPTQYVPAAIQE